MKKKTAKSKNIPINQKMLFKVRDQMIDRVDRRFHSLKSEIHGVKSEIHGVKSVVHGMKSDIHGIKSEIHGLKEEMHRIALLVEEQNARNVFVLDGLTALFYRQDRVEKLVTSQI